METAEIQCEEEVAGHCEEDPNTMKPYIGCKMIKASPMNLGDYNKFKGWDIPKDEDPLKEGYLVQYSDDYLSWSPKDVFEAAYLLLEDETKITPSVVDGLVYDVDVSRVKNTTVVMLETTTGFDSMAYSACVDPANYDECIGADLATKKAKDKLWMGLGFVLAWAKNGLKK